MPIDTRDWYRPKEFRAGPRYAPGCHEDGIGRHRYRRNKILPFLVVSIGLVFMCEVIWGDRVLSGFEKTRNHIAAYLEKYGHTPLLDTRSAVHQKRCQALSTRPANGAQAWFDNRKPLATELSGRFQIHNDSQVYLVASFTDLGEKTVSIVVYPNRKSAIDLPIVGDWHVDFVFGTTFCKNPHLPFEDGREVKVAGQFTLSPGITYEIRANER